MNMYGCVVQRSREQEELLREQRDILQQDEAELRANTHLLEQDNQTLIEQLEKFTGTYYNCISSI